MFKFVVLTSQTADETGDSFQCGPETSVRERQHEFVQNNALFLGILRYPSRNRRTISALISPLVGSSANMVWTLTISTLFVF